MSDKPARVPHADRLAVVREFCTCLWAHRQNPNDPTGPALARIHTVHPDCVLHGQNAERSPF